MNKTISKLVLIIGLIFLGFISCRQDKNDNYLSEGKITGPDVRMCACCGGWYIQIDSLTYEFDSLPVNSTINLEKESFPLLVKLDWQLSDKAACPDTRITIQRIIPLK